MPLCRIAFVTLVFLAVHGCTPPSSPPPAPAPTPPAPPSASAAPAAKPVVATPATKPQVAAPAQPAALRPGAGATASESPAGTAVKTPSGLEYTVMKEGVGATPVLGSMVKVHVVGTRASDHAEFMNTRNAGGVPKEYKLDSLSLVRGWVETLTAMRTGEKRKVHMPHALAYGVRGLPEVVPPRTDVDFEIELVSFTPPGTK